jgi:hydroxypyruvate reductase
VERSRKKTADLRRDAETILRSAIEAVEPERLVRQALEARGDLPASTGRTWITGFGKAAAAMARGATAVLGDRIDGGVLVVPAGGESQAPDGLEVFGGGHPVPDQGGVAGSCAIRQLAREAAPDDLLICLISGGGSSLLNIPPDGLPLEDLQTVTRLLLGAGATIGEINCVRKHLDELKGGRLAREAAPARVLALVLSDVPGDPLDVIASGPLAPDPTRFDQAVTVLRGYGLWDRVPHSVRGYLDRGVCGELPDSPKKSDRCFEKIETVIVGNGDTAARGACATAEELGYDAQLLSSTLVGEAREVGKFLAETALTLIRLADDDRPPTCVVTAGETSVTVRGDGIGGRNQELALGAAIALDGVPRVLLVSMGTDGVDGPTAAAGAVVTGKTLRRSRELGMDCESALARNDAYSLLHSLDDLIVSGPTGTNVADIQVLLVG